MYMVVETHKFHNGIDATECVAVLPNKELAQGVCTYMRSVSSILGEYKVVDLYNFRDVDEYSELGYDLYTALTGFNYYEAIPDNFFER